MVHHPRQVETPLGPLILRPEAPADAPFLFRLFSDNRAGLFHQAGVPESTIAHLLSVQHRSQTASYRAAFPEAAFLVVEFAGAPVGRLVTAEQPPDLHVVDIALLPEVHNRGFGSALVRSLCERAAARGGGVHAQVAIGNAPSRAMFGRLGFTGSAALGAAELQVRWPAPD